MEVSMFEILSAIALIFVAVLIIRADKNRDNLICQIGEDSDIYLYESPIGGGFVIHLDERVYVAEGRLELEQVLEYLVTSGYRVPINQINERLGREENLRR